MTPQTLADGRQIAEQLLRDGMTIDEAVGRCRTRRLHARSYEYASALGAAIDFLSRLPAVNN